MSLTRDEILGIVDIKTKKLEVPQWGKSIYIRQLTRGEQDEHLKRQYGSTRLKQDSKAKQQEISAVNIYGHDAFLVVCGACDRNGDRLFTNKDIVELNKKSGEAIGFIATEIVNFSGMKEDVEEINDLKN